HFDRTLELARAARPSGNFQSIELHREIAAATATGNWTEAATRMLRLGASRPSDLDDPNHIAYLAEAIEQSEWQNRDTLAAFLHALAAMLGSEGDSSFLDEQIEARDAALGRNR
ncbi:MAG: hypothetical protein KDB80_08125, partial [Planctomycetes bacterium]|nr:hypothetical protein [Planctomycetota bacterium]